MNDKSPDRFIKRHDYLICVDSDGCAVDTMDIKHIRCFGPCMIREWGLEQWREPLQKRWEQINLYSLTRGINRFKGLALELREVNDTMMPIEGIGELEKWAAEAPELSNPALEREAARTGSVILSKALAWSKAVNENIARLPWAVKRAFPGVREAFEAVRGYADIAIVSSANRDAVEEEWERFGLMPLVDVMMCQDVGSKAYCIGRMLEKGYQPDHVLMCGDALGDLKAAEQNGVFFYPVLVKHEAESWKEFPEAAEKLRTGDYASCGEQMKQAFIDNLTNR